jgi:hypothetical protein
MVPSRSLFWSNPLPRPCQATHRLSPHSCRICHWCLDPSERGQFHRRFWDEPEPPHPPAREIVPGLADPLQEAELDPTPGDWAFRPEVAHRHRRALFQLARTPLPAPGRREGAGVLLLGGGRYWAGCVVAVRMLRDTGCRLPVQIWHRGQQEPIQPDDLTGVERVEVRDLTALQPAPRILRGWESKTVALLACGWERVFFLDADAYCVRDPEFMLDRLSQALPFTFWLDAPMVHEPVRWSAWGLAVSRIPFVQGGQFAIDVRHFWRELVLAHWINQHSDFSYAHQYGDQDSWRVALTATAGPYHCEGPAREKGGAYVCDGGGQPLVVHRFLSKMILPAYLGPGDRWNNRRLDNLPGEARAWAYFDALRASRSP